MGTGIHWNSLLGWFYVDEPYAYSYTAGQWLWLHGESERETYSFWCYGDGHWGWSVSDLYPEYNEYRSGDMGAFGPTPVGMVRVGGGMLPAVSGLGELNVSTFYIGKYEVTWGEWQTVWVWAFFNGYHLLDAEYYTRCTDSTDDHPVNPTSWYDAVKWCNAKSEMEGLTPVYTVNGLTYRAGNSNSVSQNLSANGYRLPMEAEWEFAARGGNQSSGYIYSGSNNLDEVGWSGENSGGGACSGILHPGGVWPVGRKAANELGLHDMSGNFWEWCWDASLFDSSRRSIRGGSIVSGEGCAVSTRRLAWADTSGGANLGFRLARSSGDRGAGALSLFGGLAFGKVPIGQSATRSFTILNRGNSVLTVSSINYPAGFSGNWSGGSVAAGASSLSGFALTNC